MQVNLTTLKNGLRVATVERPQTETVSLGIWVNTGSAYETPEDNGISHFIEHMVFKGTKKRNALQISEDIENVGGQMNAYTSREFTAFYAKMLKNDLELAIDVLADMIMTPQFADDEMEKEKDVVIQEIKQTYDDPGDIIFDYFNRQIFLNQSIGRDILGTEDNVRGFTAERMRKYMHKHYTAENSVVVAVGNLKHDDFVKMVEDRMSDLSPKADFVKGPQTYVGGQNLVKRDMKQSMVLLGFNGVDAYDDRYYDVAVFSTVLGGGSSSRLFQEIREKRGLVYSVYSFASSYTKSGIFGIYAGLNACEIKKYLPVVSDELKKMANDCITPKELNRARAQFKAGILMSLESSSSIASIVARQYQIHKRVIQPDEIVAKIDSITPEKIREVAQQILKSKLTYTVLGDTEACPSYEEVQNYLHF